METTVNEVEDTLVTRTESIPGLVEICTLHSGDEFETDYTGGKVVWAVNRTHAKAAVVTYDGCVSEVSIAPSFLVRVRKRHGEQEAKPAAATPIKVVQIVVPTAAEAYVPDCCKFNLDLTDDELKLKYFEDSANLFCYGIYHNWTKDTFWRACKMKFPGLKVDTDYAACVRQIHLYTSKLRRCGKIK